MAQLYALHRNDDHEGSQDEASSTLASMILSGPLSDGQYYIDAQWDEKEGSLGTLPPYIQQRILALEKDQAYDTAEYQALNDVLTGYFTLRTQPAPDCWQEAVDGANLEIYVGMQGASEFVMHVVLAGMNLTGQLPQIDVPVLLSHGRFDTMRPAVIRQMKSALPRAETLFLPRSGHVSMIDEPGSMNDGVADFYDRVEAALASHTEFIPRMNSEDSTTTTCHSQSALASVEQSSSTEAIPTWLQLILVALLSMCAGYWLAGGRTTSSRSTLYTAIPETTGTS